MRSVETVKYHNTYFSTASGQGLLHDRSGLGLRALLLVAAGVEGCNLLEDAFVGKSCAAFEAEDSKRLEVGAAAGLALPVFGPSPNTDILRPRKKCQKEVGRLPTQVMLPSANKIGNRICPCTTVTWFPTPGTHPP